MSDLTSFANETDYFSAEHGFDCYLFSPGSRPEAVSDLYEKATVSPLKTIRRCNILRTDGKTGSRIFSLTPVLQTEKTEDCDADLNFRKVRYSKQYITTQLFSLRIIKMINRSYPKPLHHEVLCKKGRILTSMIPHLIGLTFLICFH